MLFVGAMTGTSVDALDLALLDLPSDVKPLAASTVPLPGALRERLLGLAQPGVNEVERMGQAHTQLGAFIGTTTLDFLATQQIQPHDVRAIGSHGQTIRHQPHGASPFTLQIGDGNVIAEITGIDVVTDFRGRDLAAGGQGAPLVPLYHQALFGASNEPIAIVNIGGIANVSILRAGGLSGGFDTGPGNALVDAWTQSRRGESFDANGDWARSGSCQSDLLAALLREPFYEGPPPKSTGKELFNLNYLETRLSAFPTLAEVDVQATLVELTAKSIADALDNHASDCRELVICGGGRNNGFLMERLAAVNATRTVRRAEELNVDGDAIEAAAFAYLAWQHIERIPGSASAVTGAQGPRVLGCLYPAN